MRIKKILTTLNSIKVNNPGIAPVFICGGIPRDKIIGTVKSKFEDLDITTGDASIRILADRFSEMMAEVYNAKKKVAEDGHVSVKLGSFKVDFSSNFTLPNIEELLKNKGIDKPTNMQKEVYSRDFTCNALLLSLDLKNIEDPTGRGLADIKRKMIDTCFDPDITLKYNINRIPRIVYVASKLGFQVDAKIIDWVVKNPAFVKQVKPRYMLEKLEKSIEFDKGLAINLIERMNLWPFIPQSFILDPFRKTK